MARKSIQSEDSKHASRSELAAGTIYAASSPCQRPTEDPLHIYLGSLSPRSRVTVQKRLRAVAKMIQIPYEQVDWRELRAPH